MLDYSRKYDVSEFKYFYAANESNKFKDIIDSEIIRPALVNVKSRYNINFTQLEPGDIPHVENNYVLYGPTNILNLSEKEKNYLSELSKVSFVNVVSAYELENEGDDTESYKLNQDKIPLISKELGVNVIYPDNLLRDVRTVDSNDVMDNIICETIRIKYNPIVDESVSNLEFVNIKNRVQNEIDQISGIYKKYKLWHRAPTDGAILIIDSGNILISQTKTNKVKLNIKDFSLITGFDVSKNVLTYIGERLPSSDGPEFITFLDMIKSDNQSPRYIFHFHKNEIIRAERFEKALTKSKIEYGRFESGVKMFDEIGNVHNNYLLLREHGIVWWGDSLDQFEGFLNITLGLKQINESEN